MRWGSLTAILFILFFVEVTVVQVFLHAWNSFGGLTSRLVLVMLILISLHIGPKRIIVLGILFGLFYDILFSDLIGVYAFSMAFIPYVCSWMNKYFQLHVLLVVLTVFVGVFLHESLVYFLFSLFGLTGEPYIWLEYLSASLLNMLFAIFLYRMTRRKLEQMENLRKEEGSM